MVDIVGRSPAHRYRATCNSCSAILEYVNLEVQQKVERDHLYGGTDTYYYIKCPDCKSEVRVKYPRWPNM